MGEPGEPADGVTSSEGEGEDLAAAKGRVDNGEGQDATSPASDRGPATEAAAVHGTWLRRHRVGLGIGVATVAAIVAVVGGVTAGAGDDRSSPPGEDRRSTSASTTTTTVMSTTTSSSTPTTVAPTTGPPAEPVGEPAGEPTGGQAADDGVMTPITPPSHTVPACGPGPWGLSHPQGAVPGAPDQAILVDGPNNDCSNAATGCNVSISTTWSDGVTASDSRVLTAVGTHTLNDGRGTTATFSVSSDLSCAFNGAEFSNVWPGGT